MQCDDLDFHPTDVLEDADGSLIVIDTGGWYKLCCPTSQLEKPDVLGAIYRIRPQQAQVPADPYGKRIDWSKGTSEQLVALLGDRRPFVRRRAQSLIAGEPNRFSQELSRVIVQHDDAETRQNAVWTATQIAGPEARAAVRAALADSDSTVRQAAAHGVSVWRDEMALDALLEMMVDKSAHNRRVSAECLGRLRRSEAIPAILRALETADGRVLSHSLTYALIEIGDASALRPELSRQNPSVFRAVLLALDQMAPSQLQAKDVIPNLVSSDPITRQTAAWIVRQHPAWADDVTRLLQNQMRTDHDRDEATQLLLDLVPLFSDDERLQDVVGQLIGDPSIEVGKRSQLLIAIAKSSVQRLPDAWAARLSALLSDPQLANQALETLAALPDAPSDNADLKLALTEFAEDTNNDPQLRLKAAAVITDGMATISSDLFELMCQRTAVRHDLEDRRLAVQSLVRAQLSVDQRVALIDHVKNAGPMELGPLLQAYKQTQDDQVGLKLVAALSESDFANALPWSVIAGSVDHFGPKVKTNATNLLKQFQVDTSAQRERLERLLAELPDGDIRRGQRVFHAAKAACSACHAMGYLGGQIGPDLTRIGKIRSRRDLLESIVFPNASFVRSYEPLNVMTVDGRILSGVVREDSSRGITLIDGQRQERRIPRAEIDETLPGKVSVMPSGLDQQLTPAELADLLAFLQDAK